MDEIRWMTMTEFITYTDLIAEAHEATEEESRPRVVVREATQADIDRLLA